MTLHLQGRRTGERGRRGSEGRYLVKLYRLRVEVTLVFRLHDLTTKEIPKTVLMIGIPLMQRSLINTRFYFPWFTQRGPKYYI